MNSLYQIIFTSILIYCILEFVTVLAFGKSKIIIDKYYKIFIFRANQNNTKNPFSNKIINVGYKSDYISISKTIYSFLFPYYILNPYNSKIHSGVIFRYSKTYKLIKSIYNDNYKPINLVKLERKQKLKKLK